MAKMLFDRMSGRVAVGFVALVFMCWLTVVGTLIYIALHFIAKYW